MTRRVATVALAAVASLALFAPGIARATPFITFAWPPTVVDQQGDTLISGGIFGAAESLTIRADASDASGILFSRIEVAQDFSLNRDGVLEMPLSASGSGPRAFAFVLTAVRTAGGGVRGGSP